MLKERSWTTLTRPEIRLLGERTHEDFQNWNFELTAEEKLLQEIRGDPNITGTSYAWSGTAIRVAEKSLIRAYENTQGPFLVLDLASSFPIWPQTIRELYKDRCFIEGTRLVEETILDVTKPGKLDPFLSSFVLDKFSNPNGSPRRLLHYMAGIALNTSSQTKSVNPEEKAQELKQNFMHGFKNLIMLGTIVQHRRVRED